MTRIIKAPIHHVAVLLAIFMAKSARRGAFAAGGGAGKAISAHRGGDIPIARQFSPQRGEKPRKSRFSAAPAAKAGGVIKTTIKQNLSLICR